ncbi:MAG TPA: hypothetical protein VF574_17255 [Allosphingosinicella sp.]
MAASLLGLPSGAAAIRKPAKGNLDDTLARAALFCERAASRDAGAGFQPPPGGGIAIRDGRPPAIGTPDLVKRFADTQPMGRLASAERFYIQFMAPGGDVWAVVYDKLPGCDVMVTNAQGDMPAAASRLVASLQKSGWQVARSTAASAAMPLAQYVLGRRLPKTGAADLSLSLRIRALSGSSADPTGVQLELSFGGATGAP